MVSHNTAEQGDGSAAQERAHPAPHTDAAADVTVTVRQTGDWRDKFYSNPHLTEALKRLAEQFSTERLGTLVVVYLEPERESGEAVSLTAREPKRAAPNGVNYGVSSQDRDPYRLFLPSEDDINRQYLLAHGWTVVDGAAWAQFVDPDTHECVDYLEACARQDLRETVALMREEAEAVLQNERAAA